jgi:peroxiredoxin
MISPGSKARAFDLLLAASAGKRARLAELTANAPVLVVFFKTECPTCKLAFPILERIWKRLRDVKGTGEMVAIAQNHPSEIPSFAKTYGATFPIATEDEPYEASNAYEVTNVPSLFLVDEHGVVLRTAVGFSRQELDALAKEFVARAAPPAAGPRPADSLFTAADAGLPALQPG